MAKALKVVGLMNVQFAIQGEGDEAVVYVLEVNPRASRTVPFVSARPPASRWPRSPRAAWSGRSWPTSAARDGARAARGDPAVLQRQGSGVPVQQVPGRRPDPRPRDALDRRGDGRGPHLRRGDAEEPARRRLAPARPRARSCITVKNSDKARAVEVARDLHDLGFQVVATKGTAAAIADGRRAGARRSTRSRTAGRTSSTWSRPARSSWSSPRSTRPARRSPIRATSAPAALAHRVTYYTTWPAARRRSRAEAPGRPGGDVAAGTARANCTKLH